jgi:hypothetical protein
MAVDAGEKPVNGKKNVGTPKRKSGGGEKGATPKAVKEVEEVEEVGEESLARWAEEDAAALSLLVSLIPAQHYAAAELLANKVPSKYVKKAKGTESEKVARAKLLDGAKKARRAAKFDTDAAEKKEEESDSDEEGGQSRSEDEEEEDVGTDKVNTPRP